MKHLVIGLGEVGSAIFSILSQKYEVWGMDIGTPVEGRFDYLHICIPYTESFIQTVRDYQEQFGGLLVIHSTVPVGTSRILNAVHSPIRGVHPNLEGGIRTFVKYFGGERAGEVADIFSAVGIKTVITDKSENTEAEKLWETEQYRRFILLNKEIYEYCEKVGVDFDFVYTQANRDYNEGYTQLGRPEVVRPWLKHIPGPIGGHCVEPNHKLLFPNENRDTD